MATVSPSPAIIYRTVGEIMAAVPSIPPLRIRLAPRPGTATEQDIVNARADKRALCELIDGILVEKAMGYEESIILQNILAVVHAFVKKHDLGVVAGEAGMVRLSDHQVRIPDGSFISWNQLPDRQFPNQPIWDVYPDLAIEVLSESNTAAEMQRKIEDYFAAGTRLVWIVDRFTQTVRVHSEANAFAVKQFPETLDGGDVLPGLQLPIADIFG